MGARAAASRGCWLKAQMLAQLMEPSVPPGRPGARAGGQDGRGGHRLLATLHPKCGPQTEEQRQSIRTTPPPPQSLEMTLPSSSQGQKPMTQMGS